MQKSNKLYTELEIKHIKNVGWKYNKENNEIPTKMVGINSLVTPGKVGYKYEAETGLAWTVEEKEEEPIIRFLSMTLLYGIIVNPFHDEILSRELFVCVIFLCELYRVILNYCQCIRGFPLNSRHFEVWRHIFSQTSMRRVKPVK
jgi:hypothetical protein